MPFDTCLNCWTAPQAEFLQRAVLYDQFLVSRLLLFLDRQFRAEFDPPIEITKIRFPSFRLWVSAYALATVHESKEWQLCCSHLDPSCMFRGQKSLAYLQIWALKSFETTGWKEHRYVEALHEVMLGHKAMRRRVRVSGNALQIIPSPLSVMLDLDM